MDTDLSIKQILTKYWGHTSFRHMQEDIINSVISDKDTLALLPTGGGKSLCYQIPAMAKEGLCIVVSPLIALMKDQVQDLNDRGIKAIAVVSGMQKREIDIAIDNCVYGDFKFLYLSPERLETEIIKARVRKMNVNLIAVDEAHCISQWGYDFRPSYLKIQEFRELLPSCPVVALTATATPEVAIDIKEKLLFKNGETFQSSYKRENLCYAVVHEEDKIAKLYKIVSKVKGSGIIYTRSRKKTEELCKMLLKNNESADFYHAGLTPQQREVKQNNWMKNKTRIIISTNAFGMGINKPDVRFVIHIDMPDSPEAYFQEAGRAGRDEKKAYAILLTNEADKMELEKSIVMAFPTMEEIKHTYQCLANYYTMAIGSPGGTSYDFNIYDLCNRYNLNPIKVFNCLKFLEKENYISVSDSLYNPSRVHLLSNKEELYKFQIANPAYDYFIKCILRSYGGIFDNYVKISEDELSKRANISRDQTIKFLQDLGKYQLLSYIPQTNLPQLTFTGERISADNVTISKENLTLLKLQAIKRMEWMIYYTGSLHKCRSQLLLSYFGERNDYRCGICDVCMERNKLGLSSFEFETVSEQIKKLVNNSKLTLAELVQAIQGAKEENSIKVIQWLMDNNKLKYDEDKLVWQK